MKIYCDTDTMWNNALKQSDGEWIAVAQLLELRKIGKIRLIRSAVVAREIENTKDDAKRGVLLRDYNALEQIELDEKVHGFENQTDSRGATLSTQPIVSDVQDPIIVAKLREHGIGHRDAQHIAQAIANKCDAFMTRDKNTIINEHGKWIEEYFGIKVRTPSVILMELQPPRTEATNSA